MQQVCSTHNLTANKHKLLYRSDQNINIAHKKYSKQLANQKLERKTFLPSLFFCQFSVFLTTQSNKCRAQHKKQLQMEKQGNKTHKNITAKKNIK